jgi:hypothetical protein
MFVRSHSSLFRILAALTLVAWTGMQHHDAWLELVDQDHHHDQHAATDHHHGHSHHGESEHDHQDSIPLPDTHSDPITPNSAKVGVDGPKPVSDASSWMLLAVGLLLPDSFSSECEHPPPMEASDLDPPALILLAHSVQSNAPPILS